MHVHANDVVNLWSFTGTALQSDAAHEWMEDRAFYLQILGLAIAGLAWAWLIYVHFGEIGRGDSEPCYCRQSVCHFFRVSPSKRDSTAHLVHGQPFDHRHAGSLHALCAAEFGSQGQTC